MPFVPWTLEIKRNHMGKRDQQISHQSRLENDYIGNMKNVFSIFIDDTFLLQGKVVRFHIHTGKNFVHHKKIQRKENYFTKSHTQKKIALPKNLKFYSVCIDGSRWYLIRLMNCVFCATFVVESSIRIKFD